jgi:hypothetical protein
MRTTTSFMPQNQATSSNSLTSPAQSGYSAPATPTTAEPISRLHDAKTPTATGQPEANASTSSTHPPNAQPIGLRAVTGLTKWEGKILSVGEDFFTAELHPIDREGMPITADFDLELLGSDATNAVPGDVFYLSVRTVKSSRMRPTRTETLRLRRLGRISQKDVQDAYAKADALMEQLEQLFD